MRAVTLIHENSGSMFAIFFITACCSISQRKSSTTEFLLRAVPILEKTLYDFLDPDLGPEALWDLSTDSFSEDPTGKSQIKGLRKKIPIMLL